jgi:hypothetical protein
MLPRQHQPDLELIYCMTMLMSNVDNEGRALCLLPLCFVLWWLRGNLMVYRIFYCRQWQFWKWNSVACVRNFKDIYLHLEYESIRHQYLNLFLWPRFSASTCWILHVGYFNSTNRYIWFINSTFVSARLYFVLYQMQTSQQILNKRKST